VNAAAEHFPGVQIHETACVDLPCEIGHGTAIWHFCHILPGSRIGRGCSLGQNVMVANGVSVGDHVKIQNNVSLYTGVTIDDYVFLGPSMVFTNVLHPRSEVPRKNEYAETRVGRGATLGANCTVVCGNDIGAYAFIAAGAVVNKDVPAYALMVGTPARRVGWACRCGESLPREIGEVSCHRCGNRYRLAEEGIEPVHEVQG